MYELGYESYFFGDGVCLIEWASLIEEIHSAYKSIRSRQVIGESFQCRYCNQGNGQRLC